MLILGSSSPRRIELLKTLTSDFKIMKPLFDESTLHTPASTYALEEAKNKYFSLKNHAKPEDFIICCDTIVVLDDVIFGKPKDSQDAFNILKKLSGNTHKVISGYVIGNASKNILIEKMVVTEVTFNKLSDDEINNYIKEENVFDKAGSYAIQDDEKYHLISKIKGSYFNVMGFPLEDIKLDLIALGII